MYAGLWKLGKIEVRYFFENLCTRVYGDRAKIRFEIFLKINVPGSTGIGQNLRFDIFLKIHVPGCMEIGQK